MEYIVVLFAANNEVFAFSQNRPHTDDYVIHAAIGRKILLFYKTKNQTVDLFWHRPSASHSGAARYKRLPIRKIYVVKSPAPSQNDYDKDPRITYIERIVDENKISSDTPIISESHPVKYMIYVVFVDVETISLSFDSIFLYDNRLYLDAVNDRLLFIDILYLSKISLSTLLMNKIELFSYGMVTFDVDEGRVATRIVMAFSQATLQFIDEEKNKIFLVNARYKVEYEKPGHVVLYTYKKKIICFFQYLCCLNTNTKLKHSLKFAENIYNDEKPPTIKKTRIA